MTKLEKRLTNTNWELSLVYKFTLFKFLIAAIIPWLGYNDPDSVWFGSNGLVEEATLVITFLFIGEIIRIILNPKFLIIYIKRKIETSKEKKSELTQKAANLLYENDEVVLGKSVSVMLVFCFTILFYAPIIPGITIIGIIGSVLMYWVLKIVLLRRNVVKRQIDGKLLVVAVKILKLGIFLNALTSFLFLFAIFDYVSIPALIALIFSIIFCLLPVRSFLIDKFVKRVERDGEEENYFKYEQAFMHYDIHNPLTRAQGVNRLKGNSLKNAIRRAILQKIQQRARRAGIKEVDNLVKDPFGMRDLDLLMYARDEKLQKYKHHKHHSHSSSSKKSHSNSNSSSAQGNN